MAGRTLPVSPFSPKTVVFLTNIRQYNYFRNRQRHEGLGRTGGGVRDKAAAEGEVDAPDAGKPGPPRAR